MRASKDSGLIIRMAPCRDDLPDVAMMAMAAIFINSLWQRASLLFDALASVRANERSESLST
ncbi:MAG: hypothetical protein ACQET4_07140 [Pseudomonadota bacterium]